MNQQSSKDHKRNKSGKRAAAVSQSVATKESEREASPPLPVEKSVSKHQSKKAKKQVYIFILCSFRDGDEMYWHFFVAREGSKKRSQVKGQETAVIEIAGVFEHFQ